MRTRSSSNLPGEYSPNPTSSNPKRCNRRHSKQPFILEESPVDMMADQRTMAELLRAPTEGYAETIVVPPILAEHFELKHSLINMMTLDQFFGLEKDNPHDHICWFNKIISIIKYKDVPNSAIKLMLFPFSLAGAARRWLEKEPPCSILTWEDIVSKFINELFPPSRTINLHNEISNFQQRFDESFHEAWDRYKDLLRACPHHGFTELHQLATFYNALNPANQDSLNSAAGGNLLERHTQDVLTIIENKSKIAKLTHAVNQQTNAMTTVMTAILKQFQATPPPASVKAVEEICGTCGGAHSYYQCLAADGNTFPEFRDNIQGYVSAAAVNYNQAGITRDVFVSVGKFTFSIDFVIVDYESDPRVPLILGRPFLWTAHALINVHGEEMILHDGDERLTLNMRHDTLSYSNQPQKESINMINIYNDSYEDYLEYLFATNHLNLHPPHTINPLSGSTTSSPNHLLEEFTDELALITFPRGNDDLLFDIESGLREIEYLLNHDPTKEMDSILKDSIDEYNLADPNVNLVDTFPEMFTDEHALDYSSPPLYDEYDDDLFELEFDTDNAYNDPFDSKEEKIKESKLLIDELDPPRSSDFLPFPRATTDKNVKNISNASLILEDFDPPLHELPFHKEVPSSKTLLSFSSENEEKKLNPRFSLLKEFILPFSRNYLIGALKLSKSLKFLKAR
nr:reverse transcriptase domain-containing protein [Tanacetum cinerariifolium]